MRSSTILKWIEKAIKMALKFTPVKMAGILVKMSDA